MSVTAESVHRHAPSLPRNARRICLAAATAAAVAAGAYDAVHSSSATGSGSNQALRATGRVVAPPPAVLNRHVAGMWSASEVAAAAQSSKTTQLPARAIRLGR